MTLISGNWVSGKTFDRVFKWIWFNQKHSDSNRMCPIKSKFKAKEWGLLNKLAVVYFDGLEVPIAYIQRKV